MFKKFKDFCINYIYDFLYTPIFFRFVYFRDLRKIEKYYRGFQKLSRSDIRKYTFFYDLKKKNVSGEMMAEISKMIDELALKPKNILLDGDNKSIVKQFTKRFGFGGSRVLTVGIGTDFDYDWNFEDAPPITYRINSI